MCCFVYITLPLFQRNEINADSACCTVFSLFFCDILIIVLSTYFMHTDTDTDTRAHTRTHIYMYIYIIYYYVYLYVCVKYMYIWIKMKNVYVCLCVCPVISVISWLLILSVSSPYPINKALINCFFIEREQYKLCIIHTDTLAHTFVMES